MKQKIIILSVKAGSGHIRAAEALKTAFKERYKNVEAKHVEALELTNAAFSKSFTEGYHILAKDLPSIWGYIYKKMDKKAVTSKTKKLTTLFNQINLKPVFDYVQEEAPDAVICTHYIPAEILASNRRKGNLACPLFVTLTDYDIHTMWIQDGVDHYFVACDEMSYALKEKGIGRAQVSVTGIPVMPVFSSNFPEKEKIRKKLNLRPRSPTILLTVGGFGLAELDMSMIGKLAGIVENIQLLCVAGNDAKLFDALQNVAKSQKGNIIPYGYIDNIHELMAASDFAVAKSGGLTSSECLAIGLPMIILDPIPGQEERNSDFLLENCVALRANSEAHLVYKIRKLLTDVSLLQRMRNASSRIAKPQAVFDIANKVMETIC